jgi:hypothetical protein
MFRMTRTAATVAAVLVFFSGCRASSRGGQPAQSVEPRIELNLQESTAPTIDVTGLPADDLARLEQRNTSYDEWTALFRVVVSSDSSDGRAAPSSDRVAVLGSYKVIDGRLRFTPRFPLDPGQRYDVTLDPARLPPNQEAAGGWRSRPLVASIDVPGLQGHPSTRVAAVYPSSDEVPENQLRLYIAFSSPMGLSAGSRHIRLLDQTGQVVLDPFLPLDVELWNEDRTRYTVLFDPGRVKRGILPNEEMGRALIAGRRYALVVDQNWRDSAGQPLAAPFRHEFRVGPAEEHAIDPAAWQLQAPPAGTREPLVVSFPKPLDYALLQRAVTVSSDRGVRVEGAIRLEAAETRWLFVPDAPWQPGDYRLLAASILEDVAGNRIGRPFEVEAAAGGKVGSEARTASLPFRVGSRAR